jgi:hypothetical protein
VMARVADLESVAAGTCMSYPLPRRAADCVAASGTPSGAADGVQARIEPQHPGRRLHCHECDATTPARGY